MPGPTYHQNYGAVRGPSVTSPHRRRQRAAVLAGIPAAGAPQPILGQIPPSSPPPLGHATTVLASRRPPIAPLVKLSPAQSHVLSTVLQTGFSQGANPRELISAIATGIVESHLRNLSGGTGDSGGWRQERASLYPNPTNVRASAGRYFTEAKSLDTGQSPGQLAAAVQRPAPEYAGRYSTRQRRAGDLLRAYLAAAAGHG